VGEQAGAQVEVLTVHKAKGLEYPIVVVADLLSGKPPTADVIVRHATGEGWLKIGGFAPVGWDEAKAAEAREQEAEERRLLYVALTRARDHLVIPCFPDQRRAAWLDDAIGGFAVDGREPAYGRRAPTIGREGGRGAAEVTWFDSRRLEPLEEPGRRVSATVAITGSEADARRALAAEAAWEDDRKERRKGAREVAPPMFAAAAPAAPPDEPADADKPAADEAAAELADSAPDFAPRVAEEHAAAFARLVHALLVAPIGSRAHDGTVARALAGQFGLGEAEAATAAALVARARELPEIAAAAAADVVYRDLPFAVPVRGELAVGRIDLAYRKGRAWTVVDFGTAAFSDADEALAAHGPRLEACAAALATVAGASAPRALCLLGSGRLATLPA
jgi:ATP-dependent exoDNAse (exonuclease V) beta subunit